MTAQAIIDVLPRLNPPDQSLTVATAGRQALVGAARVEHGVDQPNSDADEDDRRDQQENVCCAAVALLPVGIRGRR